MNFRWAAALAAASAIALSGSTLADENAKRGFARKATLTETISDSAVDEKPKAESEMGMYKEGKTFERGGTFYYYMSGKPVKIADRKYFEDLEGRRISGVKIVMHGKYAHIIYEGGTSVFCLDTLNGKGYRFVMDGFLEKMGLPYFISPALAVSDRGMYFTFDGSDVVFFTNIGMIKKGDTQLIYINRYLRDEYKGIVGIGMTTIDSAEGIILLASNSLKCPVLISNKHGNRTGCFRDE